MNGFRLMYFPAFSQCPVETQALDITFAQASRSMILVYVLRYSREWFYSLAHAAALVSSSLTLLAVQARVSRRAHTLALHAAPAAVALVVSLAGLPHHLTVLSCRGQRSDSGKRGETRGETSYCGALITALFLFKTHYYVGF